MSQNSLTGVTLRLTSFMSGWVCSSLLLIRQSSSLILPALQPGLCGVLYVIAYRFPRF